MTVDALTTKMLDCQSFQTAHSQAHKNRSAGVSFGRLTERCRTPSWWRRARISSCSAARLRKETAAQRADNRYLKGNRGENGNSQFINQIGICENHIQIELKRFSDHDGRSRDQADAHHDSAMGPALPARI